MSFAIIGLGKSGESARKLLLRQGADASEIVTYDDKAPGADTRDPQTFAKFGQGDTLVVSPGVPLRTPWIREALARGVTLTSELGLACAHLASEKLIGVTGSVGKSTTIALLGEAARTVDPHAFVGGNFGVPLCDYALGVLSGERPRARWLILELSSYQLENCEPLRLDLAAITALSPNHLERYESLDEYYETKWAILRRTAGLCLLNSKGGDLASWATKHPGPWRLVGPEDAIARELHLENARLLGRHNQENLALAAEIALAAGWGAASIGAMKNFDGLAHRLQNLGTRRGILFINDSKATAMDSVLSAVHSIRPQVPAGHALHLLLGGKDKNLPWEQLAILASLANVRTTFFGQAGAIAQTKSGLTGARHDALESAVDEILRIAKAGDIVLLSPGGTSLDAYKSFEDRGQKFEEHLNRRGFTPDGTAAR